MKTQLAAQRHCRCSGLFKKTNLVLLAGLLALCMTPLRGDSIPANTLWFNGNVHTPGTSFFNQDNAQASQVIYNQFDVSGTWAVDSVWSDDIFFSGPPVSTNASWEIRSSTLAGTP